MKKKYFKPETNVIYMATRQMLAASGDTQGSNIYDETVDDVTFGSREDSY